MSKIRYIIAVHGIGTQRYGETAVNAIRAFVRAKVGKEASSEWTRTRFINEAGTINYDHLQHRRQGPPDQSSGEGFHPWAEVAFDQEKWRFIEVHYADILDSGFFESGTHPTQWSQSLLARLRKNPDNPGWAVPLVETVSDTLLSIEKIGAMRNKTLRDLIFDKFIGDIQIYAESKSVRQKAVSRFHTILDTIFSDPKNDSASITVLSHSLGTVLSYDALRMGAKSKREWLDKIDSWVSFGSPLDKFLGLWPENYEETDESSSENCPGKILHLNYSDEQDPVGHKLDRLAERKEYKNLCGEYDRENDVMFNRYKWPLIAHNEYWKDAGLFKEIGRKISKKKAGAEFKIFEADIYKSLLTRTYYYPVWGVVAINSLLLLFLFSYPVNPFVAVSVVFGLFLNWRMGKRIIDLSIMWRRINRMKENKEQDGNKIDGMVRKQELADGFRKRMSRILWIGSLASMLVGVFAGWAVATARIGWSDSRHWELSSLPNVAVVIGVGGLLVFWRAKKHRSEKQEASSEETLGSTESSACGFSELVDSSFMKEDLESCLWFVIPWAAGLVAGFVAFNGCLFRPLIGVSFGSSVTIALFASFVVGAAVSVWGYFISAYARIREKSGYEDE